MQEWIWIMVIWISHSYNRKIEIYYECSGGGRAPSRTLPPEDGVVLRFILLKNRNLSYPAI